MKELPKYSLILQWSPEDNCFVAICPEWGKRLNMGGPFAHGDTLEEAAREATVALEGVVECSEEPLPEPKFYYHKEANAEESG